MISVVVATYNRPEELRRVLASFCEAQPPLEEGWELLVVDNSPNGNANAVIAEFEQQAGLPLRPLWEPRRGKSRAVNTGIRASKGEFLIFTDDDVIVDRTWIRSMRRAFRSYPDAIGFAGRVRIVWEAPPPRWLAREGHLSRPNGGIPAYDLGDAPSEWGRGLASPVGANCAFRRSAFERYGLFREDLGPGAGLPGGDDTEFVYRLRKSAERIVYIPDAVVSHPIPPKRLTLSSCLRWAFGAGRGSARMGGRPAGVKTIARVPRYEFNLLAREMFRLGCSAMRRDAFENYERVQEVAILLGSIYGFAKLPRNFDPGKEVPQLDGRDPADRDL